MLYVLFTIYSGLFLGICLSVGRTSEKFLGRLSDIEATCVGFIGVGLLGYLCFWVYFLDHRLGFAFSCVCLLTGLYLFYQTLWKRRSTLEHDFTFLLKFFILTGLFYIACLNLYSVPDSVPFPVQTRFLTLPGDHMLPKLLGAKLRDGQELIPFYGDWLSSDRPPLQTGLYLLFTWDNVPVFYQATSSVFQCMWIFAVVLLAKELRADQRTLKVVLFFMTFSGFFLLNTLFTWPKLLAASLTIISMVYFWRWIKTNSISWVSLSGAALGLATLSHSGIAFSIRAFFACLLVDAKGPYVLKNLVKAFVAFALPILALFAFWKFYQQFYDPPGNRLIKWHLAGFSDIDERTIWQTLRDSYSSISFADWMHGRFLNFTKMIGDFSWNAQQLRSHEFTHTIQALSLTSLMPVVWATMFARKRHASFDNPELFLPLLTGSLLSLTFWIFAMFIPGSTSVHQGSYATLVLFFLLFCYLTKGVHTSFLVLMGFTHLLRFGYVWVFSSPPEDYGEPKISLFDAGCLAAFALLLLQLLIRVKRQSANDTLS